MGTADADKIILPAKSWVSGDRGGGFFKNSSSAMTCGRPKSEKVVQAPLNNAEQPLSVMQ